MAKDRHIIIKKEELGEKETGGRTEQLTGNIISIHGIQTGLGNVRAVNVTGLGFGDSPADFAKIFLEFVSSTTVPYTKEELGTVSSVIRDIHQRHYSKRTPL